MFDMRTYKFTTLEDLDYSKAASYGGAVVGANGQLVLYPRLARDVNSNMNMGLGFLETPTKLAKLVASREEEVQRGIAWNVALSDMTQVTALACYSDTSDSEYGSCKVLWTPSYH